MNFERIKKRGPVSKEYVGQKSAGKGLSRVFFSINLEFTLFYRVKLIYPSFLENRNFKIFSY